MTMLGNQSNIYFKILLFYKESGSTPH